ncbi:Metallo-dependent phosphatase [Mollisia scopiformis]|uniref:Purple acid phosphatase n=1 Tax=Mollisia scopiformis TaxID=149040 RepID=A0A194X9K6_MOLSC|nr:Metallo-dependent phosphatase [Mollisia scopiformis]KUJ16457.1 Metallo-dependent phosphatase [Mollisia scopiformis]
MRCFSRLLIAATALTRALAQYNDGYETVNSPTDPVQIRLAYQGPTAMMVSWNTFSQLTNPTVSYGLSPNALTQTASSSVSVTYPTSLTYNNHVNITGLAPFTTYYYLPQYSNATTPYTFTTARAAGDQTPYTVGVVVDMGTFGALGLSTVVGTGAANPLAVNEQTTIAALTEMIDSYEFIVHAGDIAYADYWLKEEIQNYLPTTTPAQGAVVYESILNAFFDEMNIITSQKAYMVNPGNHEANCDNGGTTNKTSGQKYTSSICLAGQTDFTGYINNWRMPSGPSSGVGNFWHSYDYGMTHFIHIDTETDLGNGLVGPDEGSPEYGGPFGSYTNQQVDWLTADLAAAVNRTLTPWVVVFGHRGWYLSASGSVCANCQTAFENLFYEYGVDLYINGHAHLYERTAPIYNGILDPNGLTNMGTKVRAATLYITNGAAGHYDGLDTFTTIQPYSAYHEASDYAWSTISFANSTHMTIDTLWSANNTVFDSAVLYKAHAATLQTSSTTTSSSSSTSFISSASSTSIGSSVTTNPTSTTNTATTTSTAVYPTYTNFNGQGHLFVWSNGTLQGDIGSAGTWYNTPGQNTATYTAVPLYPNGTAFTIQHSTNYCTIGSDFSFGCVATSAGAATVFGQTPDGNLTFQGSEAFYASVVANSATKPTIYATPLPVSLNIVWGGTAVVVAPTSTSSVLSSGSSSVSSTTSKPTSSSSLQSSSSLLSSSSFSSSNSLSSSVPTSQTSSVLSSTGLSSSSNSSVLFSSTSGTSLVVSSSSSSLVSTSSSVTSSNTSSSLVPGNTVTVTSTLAIPTTIYSDFTVTQTSIATESDFVTIVETNTQDDFITIVQTSTLPASTVTSAITVTETATATEDDFVTIVQTSTEPASTVVSEVTV